MDQNVEGFRANLAIFEQLITTMLQFLPKLLIVVFEAKVSSDV